MEIEKKEPKMSCAACKCKGSMVFHLSCYTTMVFGKGNEYRRNSSCPLCKSRVDVFDVFLASKHLLADKEKQPMLLRILYESLSYNYGWGVNSEKRRVLLRDPVMLPFLTMDLILAISIFHGDVIDDIPKHMINKEMFLNLLPHEYSALKWLQERPEWQTDKEIIKKVITARPKVIKEYEKIDGLYGSIADDAAFLYEMQKLAIHVNAAAIFVMDNPSEELIRRAMLQSTCLIPQWYKGKQPPDDILKIVIQKNAYHTDKPFLSFGWHISDELWLYAYSLNSNFIRYMPRHLVTDEMLVTLLIEHPSEVRKVPNISRSVLLKASEKQLDCLITACISFWKKDTITSIDYKMLEPLEETFLLVVAERGNYLSLIPEKYLTERLITAAIYSSPVIVTNKKIKFTEDMVALAVSICGGNLLGSLPEEFKTEKVYKSSIDGTWNNIKIIPDEYKDLDVCIKAVKQSYKAMPFVLTSTCLSPEDLEVIAYEACKVSGKALEYVPENIRNTSVRVCAEAAKNDDYAAEFIPAEIFSRVVEILEIPQMEVDDEFAEYNNEYYLNNEPVMHGPFLPNAVVDENAMEIIEDANVNIRTNGIAMEVMPEVAEPVADADPDVNME